MWGLVLATAIVNPVIPAPLLFSAELGGSLQLGSARVPPEFRAQYAAFRADGPREPVAGGVPLALTLDRSLASEEYRITLGTAVKLSAGSSVGAAWGLNTLGQLVDSGVATASIADRPAYAFRTVMLDVARRYHSPSTLRQAVRWCQVGKVRCLQLHLTDDQNWMFPSKSFRGVDAGNRHGLPAYTRRELESLRDFAAARGVAIVPEIDMPGHNSLVVALDPKLYAIAGSASSNCVNFASRDVRGRFKQLLREVAAVFKDSPYIHLGGDEAYYPDAERDPHFAAAIASIGDGATPETVFADFIGEMAEDVVRLGKRPIVWEGFRASPRTKARLHKELLVVAWEGDYYPADRLVADGYTVVNAGWDPLYVVNHYPYDAFTLVPLPRLYEWDPKSFGLVNVEPGSTRSVRLSRVEGGLLCWWEGHEWNAHRVLPARIAAFGSRLWNPEGEHDYAGFLMRFERERTRFARMVQPFTMGLTGSAGAGRLVASGERLTFGYRSDGRPPTFADDSDSVSFKAPATVTVQAFKEGVAFGEVAYVRFEGGIQVANLALGAKVVGSTPEDPDFPASSVTDGWADRVGTFWLGYPMPCSLQVDLGAAQDLDRVEIVPFWAASSRTEYTVSVSPDGEEWATVGATGADAASPTAAGYAHRFARRAVRYIRVLVTATTQFPPSMARIHEVRAFLGG